MTATLPLAGAELRRSAGAAFFESRAREIARPVPPDGRALRPRRAPAGLRRGGGGGLRRASRDGRVRPPRDRRQARAARARAARRRGLAALPDGPARRARRHRDRLRQAPRHGGGARARPRPRLPDDRRLPVRRRVGAGPAGGGPVRAARSCSRPSTTCCGSSCTCSSSTAACWRAGPQRTRHDAGASSFLYPFLDEGEDDLDGVLADVRESVLAKSEEISALRAATLRRVGGGAGRGRARDACPPGPRRPGVRDRQRRLGDRRDGRRGGPAHPAPGYGRRRRPSISSRIPRS